MDTFKDWMKKILKKLDIDTILDRFDNTRAVGCTFPAPNQTTEHHGNPFAISFWCIAVFKPCFKWLSKDPHLQS